MRRPQTLPMWIQRHRAWLAAVVNVVAIAGSYALAFLLRFDLRLPEPFGRTLLHTLPFAVLFHYGALHAFKLTRGWWRYVGLRDVLAALKAATAGSVALAAWVLLFYSGPERTFPRSVLLLHPLLVVATIIGVRVLVRLWRQLPQSPTERKRLVILGAGDTGEALLREILQSQKLAYDVVAFLDDDPAKQKVYIHGVPVLGPIAALPELVGKLQVDEVIVATPSASGAQMRTITEICRQAERPFKVMPATWELLGGRISLHAAREVNIEDLLRRPRVQLDVAAIGRFLTGKRVLVTGAAGSIGSEICRQVLRFGPTELTCVDHNENGLFFLERDLRQIESSATIRYRLADINDRVRIDALFSEHRPQVVFHAAAHKHVPVVEHNPLEGLRNNVFGSETVARAAGQFGAEAFVLISTDKAVRPRSVMGASKRIAEMVVQSMPFEETRYTAVRFGNVLGSAGSVVPILKEQIRKGGPVTVTHPEMRRFFMTIPEAVELVLQAGAVAARDQVLLLDMGEPVRILDLARDLIRLSGLEPERDIPIVFTGIRPGEKLVEELVLDEEGVERTVHPKILVARHARRPNEAFLEHLEALRRAVHVHDEEAALQLVPRLVPEYTGRLRRASVSPGTEADTEGASRPGLEQEPPSGKVVPLRAR